MCVLKNKVGLITGTLVIIFISAPKDVFCQRNFGFGNQNQQQQQSIAPFNVNGPGPTSQQQFFGGRAANSVQTFHQFQSNPSLSPNVFHEEEPQNSDREGRNQNNGNRVMSDTCLACLCQASTECNLATRCISNDQYCGAFLISKPYWTDAQRPTLVGDSVERDGAFIDCAVDPVCSAQTVRNYMSRFEKDCNGDEAVDCDDLARIHLMSAFDCGNPKVPTTGFYQKFRKCWDRVLQLSEK